MNNIPEKKYVLDFKVPTNYKSGFTHILLTGSAASLNKKKSKYSCISIHDLIDYDFIENVCKILEEEVFKLSSGLKKESKYFEFIEEYIFLNYPQKIGKNIFFNKLKNKLKISNFYTSGYKKINNDKDLINYIDGQMQNPLLIELNNFSLLSKIFFNLQINLLNLKIILNKKIFKNKKLYIMTSIYPWFTEFFKTKKENFNTITIFLSLENKNKILFFELIKCLIKFFSNNSVFYIPIRKLSMKLEHEILEESFYSNYAKNIINNFPKFSTSLASTIYNYKNLKRNISINKIKDGKILNLNVLLSELYSPLSFILSYLFSNNYDVISHGVHSPFNDLFTNKQLIQTIGGSRRKNYAISQSKLANYAFKKYWPKIIEIEPTCNSLYKKNCEYKYLSEDKRFKILHASSITSWSGFRLGLFPLSTEYFESIESLVRLSENISKEILVIICIRQNGGDDLELSSDLLKKYLSSKFKNFMIIDKNFAFDAIAPYADMVYSHTSGCLEKALLLNKKVICQTMKGQRNFYPDKLIEECNLPIIKSDDYDKSLFDAIKKGFTSKDLNKKINNYFFTNKF